MRLAGSAGMLLISGLALRLHLHHHFHGPTVDYIGLLAAAAASWMGVPGPGEPVLIAAGVFAARHKLDIGSVVLVAWAGATAGGIAGWLLGAKAGHALLTASGPLRRARLRALARGEQIFQRYVVLAVWIAPSWVAGIHRVRPVVYLPLNAAGAALWAAGIGLGAYWIGPTVVDLVDDLGTVLAIVAGLAVVTALAAALRQRRRHADGRNTSSGAS
ncbi:MAG: hypothetical protein ACR2LV_06245 [Solirubrobacteraceae bacterium]